MDYNRRLELLSQILSDYFIIYVHEKQYIVKRPDKHIIYKARLLRNEIADKYKFNNFLTKQDCIDHLISIGRWTIDGDQKIKQLEEWIEDQKVKLYHAYSRPDLLKPLRQELTNVRNLLSRLYDGKNLLYSFTLDYITDSVLENYILSQTIYYKKKKIKDISCILLDTLKLKYKQLMLSSQEFREISRTDPWRSYSNITSNPFNKSAVDLDEDQRILLNWSNIYTNVHENPDCPNDDIINDDDMLDGWMIVQSRKRAEEKREKTGDEIVKNLSYKYGNANEVFLPANSTEQVQNIGKLNSAKSKMVKQQRQQFIDKYGQVGAGKLPDEIFERTLQANRASSYNNRGI